MKRQSAVFTGALLGFILAVAAGTVWANGEEFFAPAKNGTVDLVYFGRIKDKQTGRSIKDSVYFLLKDEATGLSFPFTNDKPGHYRTPDVGAAIKDIGETINVNAFELDVNVAGYRKFTVTKVPRKNHGAVELDLALEPAVPDTVAAAGVNATDVPLPARTTAAIVMIGFVALFFIVRRARTSGRRPSITD
jgi:hypothetical protein